MHFLFTFLFFFAIRIPGIVDDNNNNTKYIYFFIAIQANINCTARLALLGVSIPTMKSQ